ncbi:MAG: metallophosphoesterase family protein, partial [Myxococcaceae bacterium]
MRFAVISDIHSNLEALTEVLRAVEAQKVDRVVSLGDIVGYGASPNACCDLVRSVAEVTLLGNHDAAVAGRMDYSFYYEGARHALDWSAQVLTEENHAWL